MRTIYLASPYSHPDPHVREQRFRDVCRVAGKWLSEGYLVFSPIAHSHVIALMSELPGDFAFWVPWDKHQIKAADEFWVLQLPGWESSVGVQAEIVYALELGKPIRNITADGRLID